MKTTDPGSDARVHTRPIVISHSLYINDVPSAGSFRIRLFADDANLTFSGKSTALLEQKMNEELLKVDDWMKANKLPLNYKKKKYLVVNKLKSKSCSLNIKITNKIFGSNNR